MKKGSRISILVPHGMEDELMDLAIARNSDKSKLTRTAISILLDLARRDMLDEYQEGMIRRSSEVTDEDIEKHIYSYLKETRQLSGLLDEYMDFLYKRETHENRTGQRNGGSLQEAREAD